MNSLNDFLNAVKAITGSDYKTSKEIGITTQLIGNWRGERSIPSNRHILKMCKLANISLEEAILAIENTREKKTLKKEAFKFAGATAASAGFATMGMLGVMGMLAILVTLIMTSPTLQGASIQGLSIPDTVYYVKSDINLVYISDAANDDSYSDTASLFYISANCTK